MQLNIPKLQLTDNKPSKERVNPTHDQGLGNHGHHVSFQHSHHCLHASRVRHGVGWGLATVVRILQESAIAEAIHNVVLSHLERLTIEHSRGVVAKVDSAKKSVSFSRLGECRRWLGRRVHENCCVVAQDTGEDLGPSQYPNGMISLENSLTMTTEIGNRIQ